MLRGSVYSCGTLEIQSNITTIDKLTYHFTNPSDVTQVVSNMKNGISSKTIVQTKTSDDLIRLSNNKSGMTYVNIMFTHLKGCFFSMCKKSFIIGVTICFL